jgi:hypothetical protein
VCRLCGFNSFLPLSALLWLTPSELEIMLRGQVFTAACLAVVVHAFFLCMHVSQCKIYAFSGAYVLDRRLDGVFETKPRLWQVARVFTSASISKTSSGSESAPFVWLLEVLARVPLLPCLAYSCRFALQVLQDMSEPQRRLFLRFLTGNPTLPAGGLHGLKPPITVVRRESDNSNISSDEYLPSVMTCVNYLKLPPYSSREVLAAKLHAAMSQGQAAFHLS